MSRIWQKAWSPMAGYPSTTLDGIVTTLAPQLQTPFSGLLAIIQAVMEPRDMVKLASVALGASASLSVISAHHVVASATNPSVQVEATEVIHQSIHNLQASATVRNIYGYYMNRGGNIFFLTLFALLWLFNLGMLYKSKYYWYNITFICGFTLELLGFLGRILAFGDENNINYFLLSFVPLTLAPAFVMGGIYFLFAQNVAIYGRQYSVLKPMWYSYFFIACDVASLIVQGLGGGMASVANQRQTDPAPGTWTMFGGILFQVVAMFIFIIFWLEFIARIYFRDRGQIIVDSPLKHKTPLSFLKLLLDTKSARAWKSEQLEQFYTPKFKYLRDRPLVRLYPVAVTTAVIFIFIRCVYRVVELYEGFRGYLITHEVFLMVLDASMIAVAGLIFVPFHPVFVFGPENVLQVSDVKKRHKDVEEAQNEVTLLAEKEEESEGDTSRER